jgi:isochorismate synthase EntC
LWFLRAPFDGRRAWCGHEGVRAWRPERALVADARGVFAVDADGRARVLAHVPDSPHTDDGLAHRGAPPESGAPPTIDDGADREAYCAAVRRALDAIARGDVEKIVVARRARLALPARPAFLALTAKLVARFATHATAYLVEDAADRLFFGASPEHLLRRHGRDVVEVDAVAGTRRVIDARAAQLLASDKDRREHALVVDGVRAALERIRAAAGEVSPLRAEERGGLVHLACAVRARSDAPLSVLLGALHPTPAVAGAPSGAALDVLREIEDFARGDYAGLIGTLWEGNATLSVALRAARIDGEGAWAYAGAGIVEGSEPESEWRETSDKARVLLPTIAAALGGEAP